MKNYLKVLLTVVLFGCVQTLCAQTQNVEEVVLNAIMTRCSVRQYQDKPVEQEKVEKMLRAGMAAPTAVNRQPWHFVVVNTREALDRLAGSGPRGGMLRSAPLAIAVCGDMNKALEGKGQEYWIQDTSAATENILLAAHAMGLGAVWTGAYPMEERVKSIREALQLPDHIVPLCVIVIGYPKGDAQPKDKWKPENVSYNTYGK